MQVTVKYRLSLAGQKAALIAGRPATTEVEETLEFSDVSLIDSFDVTGDGSLVYEPERKRNYSVYTGYAEPHFVLDAPPSDVATLVAAGSLYKEDLVKLHREKAEQRAREAAEKQAAWEAKAAADFPVAEQIISDFEQAPEEADIPGFIIAYPCLINVHGNELILTPEQKQRLQARITFAREYEARKTKEAADAKVAAREAMIAERGGIVFSVAGGMTKFLDADLWDGSQCTRWVGIFSTAKGIDSFLASPRGEFAFSVADLKPGQCIQGAGFDKNSRGKRRHETEWFGVVVEVSETELVVQLVDSRTQAFAVAALQAKDIRQRPAGINSLT